MKKSILAIESNKDLLEIWSETLKSGKIDLEMFNNGKEAKDKIQNIKEGKAEKPDLIMLDLGLSDMNGIEIFKALKLDESTKNIPIFVFSDHDIDELPENLNLFKQDKFILHTTIDLNQLISMVKEQLK